MIIYKATNKINGKEYVGQTVFNLEKRKYRHINSALNKRDNGYFHKAIRKYGPDNFMWEILIECVNIEGLNKLEIYYIKMYDTFDNGYNLTKGSNGSVGWTPLIETRMKIAKTLTGKKLSSEHCRSISKGRKGIKFSIETRKRISIAKKGKNNPMYGKCGKDHPNAIAVMINNQLFDTVVEAARFLNVVSSTVNDRIKRQVSGYQYA